MNPTLQGLNEKQIEAIKSEDKRLLILAGAGSGKTRTVIKKILYLMGEKNVKSEEILAITFTKNASYEMIDRLILEADQSGEFSKLLSDKKLSYKEKNDARRKYISEYNWLSNLTVKTFHSFCYYVMKNYGSKEFDNKFKIIPNKDYDENFGTYNKAPEDSRAILKKIILDKSSDEDYLIKLKRYILDNYVEEPRIKTNEINPDRYPKPYITLRGEDVRSKSERYIADWLYRHGIDYEYEPTIQIKDFPMKPDFFIPEANLFIEHVSNISSPTANKEKEFSIANKIYYKTYESNTRDIRAFYQELENIIIPKINPDIKKISALKFEEEFMGYQVEFDKFISDLMNVINKIKVENKDFEPILEKSQKDPHKRVQDFYKLIEPIYTEYRRYCEYYSYLDFNDLIIRTNKLLTNYPDVREGLQKKYKYILVDEFQDVNTLQVDLLKLLLTPETQLFCVGDDWQSIYGWRGSEVEYIVNFEKYFNNPKIIHLDINYRSHDTIVSASNEVIKNNKFQIAKEIRSFTKKGKNIYLFAAKKESEDGVERVSENITQFLENGYSPEDILILYRRTNSFRPYKKILFEDNKRGVLHKTIHSAKGLEAKVVFLVGVTGGYYGFPSVWDEDRLFQVIKESNYERKMEEERRLFYVALTRAKEELFIITELGNESSFISEIPGEFIDRSNFLVLNVTNSENNLKCESCNNNLDENFFYCPYCGKNLLGRDSEVIGSLSNTVQDSFTLYKQGKTVKEIANMRGLNVNTIYSHFSLLITNKLVDIDDIIDRERQIAILEVLPEVNYKTREAKMRLDPSFDYGEIRCVRACTFEKIKENNNRN